MVLTSREQKILEDLRAWEEKLYTYESNDFAVLYEKAIQSSFALLPEETQKEFFAVLDNMLFHFHAIIQGAQFQMEARDRILASARIFQNDIEEAADMKLLTADQLNYIAQQQIARHRLYSFAQGGISGMGGAVLIASDLPAITVINLRLVQLIAMSYGYEVNTPKEMMISLKVFQAGTLPNRLQKVALEELNENTSHSVETYFYDGNDEIVDTNWFEQPIKQVMKYMLISMFRKKKIQGLPLISMAIGASSNYALTKRVSEFAHNYYQYRFLKEKIKDVE
ncbi:MULTISPECIES: EcsC family protein [Bacillus]|uniref:EcsC family protein n=1 Tax=Bacillus TaxID=1386 RepID=UPI0002F1FF42|nr:MULTISPECIES: EcsC family protein [Bacillus]